MDSLIPLGETSISAPPRFPPASAAPHRAPRVLVLDDDAATRRLIALILARAGYSVDAAEDGELGWDALRAASYDLLVTDNEMPRLKGLPLIERLRAAGLTLPVIVASGTPGLGEARDYPWLDLAAVLHKPFDFDELIEAAHRAAPMAIDPRDGAMHFRERP